ncbi:MAG: aldehyde ferredoxin oxidoreductase N-terminal domain-containing protein, partial [Thermodesulfobacteriota bacterium]
MRWAGFDHLMISGRSKTPVSLLIKDGSIEIREASHLKETNPEASLNIIRKELKEDRIRALVTGVSNEKKSRFPALTTDYGYSVSDTGIGIVLAGKNVKAVACQGSLDLEIKHPEELLTHYRTIFKARDQKPFTDSLPKAETRIHYQSRLKMTVAEMNETIADALGIDAYTAWIDITTDSWTDAYRRLIRPATGYEITGENLMNVAFRSCAVERLLCMREAMAAPGFSGRRYKNLSNHPPKTWWDRRSLIKRSIFKALEIDELWPMMK